ncbi:hypothetical protein [Companilactobacillus sp.]|jgi:hypothetical protein|uniref:hypothetical protein n=1 Tax=Companilactobacillus sp. TaxID=2767905 RepID=UPI0025C17B28|nr:hypothetical protein [Companilactobacillus sp.]MCH4009970.1 hypothetical protein [Companilactobacillus sp.]MCH4052354.1 hypothetical protein [Companilactobacillus sp.]MCH4077912.1 hypothetical protein [Companilactobacillus sp.]MCH4126488.1 hypothetical protein [Companilactobacillus sp.]MCH4132074.1 hypothetical protein [Companilactobacillus sp.]
MELNDNTEAKKVLSELYTDINANKDIDKDNYVKDLVLRTYNLINEKYSFTYLFGRLKDDEHVIKTIKQLRIEDNNYEEQIKFLAKGATYALY